MQSFPHVNKFTQKREIKCAVLSAPPSTIPPSTLTVCVCATIAPKIASQYQTSNLFSPYSPFYPSQNTSQKVMRWRASDAILLSVLRSCSTQRKSRIIEIQLPVWINVLSLHISPRPSVPSSFK